MGFEYDQALNKTLSFLKLLKQGGIDVSEAYLFGSVLKGNSDTDSDIDVAVVSKDFQGLPYYDIKKISKFRRKIDLRLEIHTFQLSEIETDPPLFFMKIKKDGKRIL